jgi:predicted Zn-dependent protease
LKKWYKWVVPMIVGTVSVFSLISNANAYTRIGAKYTNVPYKMDYFNDCISYTYNNTLVSFYDAVQNAVLSWNGTSNTKVLMYQTTTQSQSVMDFHNYDLGDSSLLGKTSFYVNSAAIDPTKTNWYWTKTNINSAGDWATFPSGCAYTNINSEAKNVAAHEEGHALGLGHSSSYVLMYSTVASYDYYGITGPTSDEISGVQAIYGTLN